MAYSTIGNLNALDASKEKWSAYTERFEHFAIANGIDTERLVSMFLAVIGSSNYELLRNLVALQKPAENKYKELIESLQKRFEPAPLIIAERFHFHKRDQLEGEGVADYAAILKQYAERCEFAEFLEQALRDRFVCGLKSSTIQKKTTYGEKVDVARSCGHSPSHGMCR